MKIKLYQDKKGEFRWSLIARNGRILADSAEGYKRKADAMWIIKKLHDGDFRVFDYTPKK